MEVGVRGLRWCYGGVYEGVEVCCVRSAQQDAMAAGKCISSQVAKKKKKRFAACAIIARRKVRTRQRQLARV
jgi:hypothetical protein